MTQVQSPAATTPPVERAGTRRALIGRVAAHPVALYGAYVVLQAVQLLAISRLAPRLFWLDDSQSQFLPTWWWLGQNLRGAEAPLVDPDLGMAGNFTVDMQYGALDPAHWVLQGLSSLTGNILVMTWVFGAFCVLWLGLGVLTLLRQAGVQSALALAAALGAASSGFFLWFGSSWWPLLWSASWLPWLWVGLASRRWPGAVLSGVAVWVLLASGNPYIVPFVALVVLAQLYVYRREYGSWRALVGLPRFLARVVASVGGAVIAAPTLLTLVQLSPYMDRPTPDPTIGNSGYAVPSLFDALIGGTTTLGMINWAGAVGLAPAVGTFLLALPLLAFVRWRTAIREPAVGAALVVVVGAALASQLPSQFLVFRYPVRYLVYLQVFGAIFAVLAVTAARAVTRGRILAAAAVLILQLVIALARAPYLAPWHGVGFALAAGALVAFLALGRPRAAVRWTGAGALVAVALASPLAAVGEMRALESRVIAIDPAQGLAPGDVFRVLPPGTAYGTTVQQFRDNSLITDAAVTVLSFQDTTPVDRGWKRGLPIANGSLFSGLRTGGGYAAAPQKFYNLSACMDLWAKVYCGGGGVYPDEFAHTGKTWLDLVARDRVVLSPGAPERILRYLSTSSDWTADSAPAAGWTAFRRAQPLIGRVTLAQGVQVAPDGWSSGMAYRGVPEESYGVSTGSAGGSVVLSVPYWPGYRATLDGRPVDVAALDSALLRVNVPGGVQGGRLEIYYDPVGVRLAPLLWFGGALLIVLGAVVPSVVSVARRRRERTGNR